jgi:hypothetical protein
MSQPSDFDSTLPQASRLKWLGGAFLVVFMVWIGWLGLLLFIPHERLPDLTRHSQFGEMFGGINALFSALAFAGLIYTILLQRQELALQRRELILTREELTRQADALSAQNRGSMHERLYKENHALLEYLANYPEARAYFYGRRPLEECKDETEHGRLLFIAERWSGFMELVSLHLSELPAEVKDQWRRMVLDLYDSSKVIQHHLEEYERWYSKPLWDVLAQSPEFQSRRSSSNGLQLTGPLTADPAAAQMVAARLGSVHSGDGEHAEQCDDGPR